MPASTGTMKITTIHEAWSTVRSMRAWKSRRDATRLLKRYLARHLYRLLQQEPLMA